MTADLARSYDYIISNTRFIIVLLLSVVHIHGFNTIRATYGNLLFGCGAAEGFQFTLERFTSELLKLKKCHFTNQLSAELLFANIIMSEALSNWKIQHSEI